MKNCGNKIFIPYNRYDVIGGVMKLIESCICIIICLLFSNVLSAITVSPQMISTTLYVDDDNTNGPWDGTMNHPFHFIQDAIDNASSGNNIFVFNGIYKEYIKIRKESINLIAQNQDTIIEYPAVSEDIPNIIINADYVTVCNFTIRNDDFFNSFFLFP